MISLTLPHRSLLTRPLAGLDPVSLWLGQLTHYLMFDRLFFLEWTLEGWLMVLTAMEAQLASIEET